MSDATLKTYAEEPWNPIWDYKLNWTGDYIETWTIVGGTMVKKFNCPHCGIEHEISISFDQFILSKCPKCGDYILKALLIEDRKP